MIIAFFIIGCRCFVIRYACSVKHFYTNINTYLPTHSPDHADFCHRGGAGTGPTKNHNAYSQKTYSINFLILNTITNLKKKSNKDDPTGRISSM
jgi:hypothetical protein